MVAIFVFLVGLAAGSFFNVLTWRWPRGEDFIKGHSKCPACHYVLGWKDLIPLVSFVFLKRKCRYCGQKISGRYFLVELLTGIIFLTLFLLDNSLFLWTFVFSAAIAGLLVVLIFIDFDYFIIPDKILVVLSFLGFGHLFFLDRTLIFNNFLTGLITGLVCWLIYSLTNAYYEGEGMGFGDVKLVALLGFLFGFPAILPVIYLALSGSLVVGLIIILFLKGHLKTKLPFGSFLAGAAIFYLLFNRFFVPVLTPYFYKLYL